MRSGIRRPVHICSLHKPGDIGRSLTDTVEIADVEAALPLRTVLSNFQLLSLADSETLTVADGTDSRAPQVSGSNS